MQCRTPERAYDQGIKMKIQIKSRYDKNKVLFEAACPDLKTCVEQAIESGTDLSRATLSGANLSWANLSWANLIGANLFRANLFRADLSRANLSGATLYGANLSGAILSGAYLSGSNLSGANLTRADLSMANLSGSNLSGANLSRADLTGANLTGANLTRAVHHWAQVAWKGHGECGRMLTAIQLKKDDKVQFFCGCFTGSEEELREYIRSGESKYVRSRRWCLKTVLAALKIS